MGRRDKPNSHFSQLICEYTKKRYVLLAKHCSTQKMDRKSF